MIEGNPCPHCKAKTIPKVWSGYKIAPTCGNCGKKAWDPDKYKVIC